METRIYMSIWEPPWRPVWCLFLVWCNIKSSLNDRCCWQSGSKTTNHAKKKYIYQCSCRFKETKLDEWLRGNEREWKNKRQGNQSKNGREEEHWELEEEEEGGKKNTRMELNQPEGRKGRTKTGDIQAQVQIFMQRNGWRWRHHFASEGFSRRERKGFSPRGWVEQEALIRHVWTEVILYASHAPAGQLILGQVKAKAAQLENCSLGFRSLRETTLGHHQGYGAMKQGMRPQGPRSPVSAVCPWRETQTDLGCSSPFQPCPSDSERASTASRSRHGEIQTWPASQENFWFTLRRERLRQLSEETGLTWTGL